MSDQAMTREELRVEIAKLRGWYQTTGRDGEVAWRHPRHFCEFDEICETDPTGHFPAAIELFWELPMPRCLLEGSADETAVSWIDDNRPWDQVVQVDRNLAICLAWFKWKTGVRVEVSDAL